MSLVQVRGWDCGYGSEGQEDAHVPGEGVNFDASTSAEVLGRRLAHRLLEETEVFVFGERGKESGLALSRLKLPSSDSADFEETDITIAREPKGESIWNRALFQ